MSTHNDLPLRNTTVGQPPSHPLITHTVIHATPDSVLMEVRIAQDLITALFDQAAHTQQKHVRPAGFDFGEAPLAFIKQQYQHSLLAHLKEFLLKFCVLNYVYRIMRIERLVIAGDPHIATITITTTGDAVFQFTGITALGVSIQEWRYLPFRAPKRKNYKDLDRQAENFILEETTQQQNNPDSGIQENDWVCIGLSLVTEQGVHLFADFEQFFWIQISDEKVDNPLRDLLIGMRLGETVITKNSGLQEYFSEQLATDYHFNVRIVSRVPHIYVCFDHIKNHFRLKTKKDLLKKLIEVFSYRNDISQRRATVEDCLTLLLNKHPFNIPEQISRWFQEMLLTAMHSSPDYNVYRTQKDFYLLIKRLAEKMARETLLLDTLAYNEKIPADRNDIESYLNCTKRQRTKEFIYCRTHMPHHEGQATLIHEEELMRTVLREKTINHVLYHLTKE